MGKRECMSSEMKNEAIQRVLGGESKASVSRDIKVPESTLRGWCKAQNKERKPLVQNSTNVSPISTNSSKELFLDIPLKRPGHDLSAPFPKRRPSSSLVSASASILTTSNSERPPGCLTEETSASFIESKIIMTKRKQLPYHVKYEAIQRVLRGESKASVSRDINVPESTLRGWCKAQNKERKPLLQNSTNVSPISTNSSEKLFLDLPLKRPGHDFSAPLPKRRPSRPLVSSASILTASNSVRPTGCLTEGTSASFIESINIKSSSYQKIPYHVKNEAIQRVLSGETKASVSRDINVPRSTLSRWFKSEMERRKPLAHISTNVPRIVSSSVPFSKFYQITELPPASTGQVSSPATNPIASSAEIPGSKNSQAPLRLPVAHLFSDQEIDEIIENFLAPIPSTYTKSDILYQSSFSEAYMETEKILRYNSDCSFPRLPQSEISKYRELVCQYSQIANNKLAEFKKKN